MCHLRTYLSTVSCMMFLDKSSDTMAEQTTLANLLIDQLENAMEEIPTGGTYVCIATYFEW